MYLFQMEIIMKKLLLISILIPLLFFSSCSAKAETSVESTPDSAQTDVVVPFPDTPLTEAELAELADGPAGAYYVICQELFEYWTPSKYVGLNLKNISTEYHDALISLLSHYCEQHGLTLLLGNIDVLTKKGYIKGSNGMAKGFDNGVVLSFHSPTLSETELKTGAETWYGNMGLQGKTFTIIKLDGKWQVKPIVPNADGTVDLEEMWIA
jgi:hypothetical protein